MSIHDSLYPFAVSVAFVVFSGKNLQCLGVPRPDSLAVAKVASASAARLGYIDWMRGLACLVMFQTHCYDSWLSGSARQSRFFMWSQLGGTLPAPLFLFLAGISFSLVVDRLRQRSLPAKEIARITVRRGSQILGFGLLFRLQEYAIAFPWAPWTDLLRVDILNMIGVSMIMMGLCCWAVLHFAQARRWPGAAIGSAVAATSVLTLATPLLWTTWRPDWLPWPIESYINGVHNLHEPQAWLFPIFPWTGFAFAGLAVGFVLLGKSARAHPAVTQLLLAIGGAGLIALARWFDARRWHVYAVYDYWHTSPSFFLTRVGILLLIVFASYAWCRWGLGQWGFSPFIQLGTTSLLVYWVHIEFVYGRISLLPKRSMSITAASFGLLTIFLAMLVLSIVRTHWVREKSDSRSVAKPAGAS